jgi:hypothetical protein
VEKCFKEDLLSMGFEYYYATSRENIFSDSKR